MNEETTLAINAVELIEKLTATLKVLGAYGVMFSENDKEKTTDIQIQMETLGNIEGELKAKKFDRNYLELSKTINNVKFFNLIKIEE